MDDSNENFEIRSEKSLTPQLQNSFFTNNEEKRKTLIKFSNTEWQIMQKSLTGKRLSFKVDFTNNLTLRLQNAGD